MEWAVQLRSPQSPQSPQGKERGVGAGTLGTPETQRRVPPPSPSKRTWGGLAGGAEERTRSASASPALSLLPLALGTPLPRARLATPLGATGNQRELGWKFPLRPRQAITTCRCPSAARHPDRTHGTCPPARPVGAPRAPTPIPLSSSLSVSCGSRRPQEGGT